MTEASIEQWNQFLELIDEAKEFLAKAEKGEMCLNQLKSLSDRGMEILKLVEDKKLQIIMLDINLLDMLFKIFQLNVRSLSPDKFIFDPVIHAHKILHLLDERKDNPRLGDNLTSNLSPIASKVFSRRAPSLSVMSGALEITDPEKKARVAQPRLPKDKVEEAKAPEKVAEVTGQTINQTVLEIQKQLQKMYKAKNKSPICYIKFAFHPESFSKTVEHIFYIAFLVNSGGASIFLDKEGHPWIKPVVEEQRTKSRDAKSALAFGITKDEWKEAVRLFEVTEPMLKLEYEEVPDLNNSQRRRRHQ